MSLRSNAPLAGFLVLTLLIPLSACASAGGDPEPTTPPTPTEAAAPEATASGVSDGAYSAAQAEQGEQVYRSMCGECHFTREFRGTDFFFNYEGTSVGGFLELIAETMPEDDPGSLAMDQYLAVTAYILQLNEYPAGSGPLTAEVASGMTFERVGTPRLDGAHP